MTNSVVVQHSNTWVLVIYLVISVYDISSFYLVCFMMNFTWLFQWWFFSSSLAWWASILKVCFLFKGYDVPKLICWLPADNHNALTILCLWAPVFSVSVGELATLYFMVCILFTYCFFFSEKSLYFLFCYNVSELLLEWIFICTVGATAEYFPCFSALEYLNNTSNTGFADLSPRHLCVLHCTIFYLWVLTWGKRSLGRGRSLKHLSFLVLINAYSILHGFSSCLR